MYSVLKVNEQWKVCAVEQREGSADDARLQRRIVGASERVAERERGKERTRRAIDFRDFAQRRDAHRANTFSLNRGGNQTNCLDAHRSHGRQQHRVHSVHAKLPRDFRRGFVNQCARVDDRTHEAEMAVIEFSNFARRREFA